MLYALSNLDKGEVAAVLLLGDYGGMMGCLMVFALIDSATCLKCWSSYGFWCWYHVSGGETTRLEGYNFKV